MSWQELARFLKRSAAAACHVMCIGYSFRCGCGAAGCTQGPMPEPAHVTCQTHTTPQHGFGISQYFICPGWSQNPLHSTCSGASFSCIHTQACSNLLPCSTSVTDCAQSSRQTSGFSFAGDQIWLNIDLHVPGLGPLWRQHCAHLMTRGKEQHRAL